MAMTPVPTKPGSLGTPDVWRSFPTDIDRLFDQFVNSFGLSPLTARRLETAVGLPNPAVEITEDATGFKLSAELPGLTEKDVEVSLAGGALTIKGEKRQEKTETKQDYHLTERTYGEFRRSFVLPQGVDAAKVEAKFANGVLTVMVPKSVKEAPQKIEVKPAG